MEYAGKKTTSSGGSATWLSPSSAFSTSTTSSNPPHSPAPAPAVIVSPCAACKILRRRCTEECLLAPYFPPTEPLKFTAVHRVFGASNITKLLQELRQSEREDAVSSMVYEANARIREPVYGCVGTICLLQKQVSELQAEVAKKQAELLNMQSQHANLLAFVCKEMSPHSQPQPQQQQQFPPPYENTAGYCFSDDESLGPAAWEPLWT